MTHGFVLEFASGMDRFHFVDVVEKSFLEFIAAEVQDFLVLNFDENDYF